LRVSSALKAIESHRLKKGALLSKNAVANDVTGDPVAQILTKYNLDNQAWDNLSHFVLRLAYCKVGRNTRTQMLLTLLVCLVSHSCACCVLPFPAD
jgi:hypothetical protein